MELDTNEINSISSKICPDCNKSYIDIIWCKDCNAKQFRQNFPNWTSGNEFIDSFIQETQLNARNSNYVLEWIPYDRFKDINYIDKERNCVIYKAIWLDGPIEKWSYKERKWIRYNEEDQSDGNSQPKGWKVDLKSLNSNDLNDEYLNKVQYDNNISLVLKNFSN